MPDKIFPMQDGPNIPWATAEPIYEAYAILFGKRQSMERIAERGGFGWAEVEEIFKQLYKKDTGAWHRLMGHPNE